jgi:carbonic anhydrase
MTAIDTLVARNARFASDLHTDLPQLPRLRMCVVTCPDPRVDPAQILGLELGDAAVVRAAAGRISPIVLQQLMFLVAGAPAGQDITDGFELLLMQHTDCGIARLDVPEHHAGLAAFLGCAVDELPGKHVGDPYEAVRVDVDAVAGHAFLPAGLAVTGMVYDLASGRVEIVERRDRLRAS